MNKFIKLCVVLWILLLSAYFIKNLNKQTDKTNPDIVEIINDNQSKITSVICRLNASSPVDSEGSFCYEKESNFRFVLYFKKIKKLDLGSNENLSWFLYENFSKKVHYWKKDSVCDVIHEFNPEFIKQIFIYKISENPIILKSHDHLKIVEFIRINGFLIKKITIVKNNNICSHLFYDEQDNLQIECKILENQFIENVEFPQKINLISKTLGSVVIEIQDLKINQEIEKKIFEMPKVNSIDISQ